MNINILTSSDSEFADSALALQQQFIKCGHAVAIYTDHSSMEGGDLLFILSYFRILSQGELAKHHNNIVVHASNLPAGKGFSPMAWQIAEGKRAITFTLFEAVEALDAGPVYMKDTLNLNGTELYDEWKKIQNQQVIDMVYKFVSQLPGVLKQGSPQIGEETVYRRRNISDNQLDVERSLSSQFDVLRICNPDKFPAWFLHRGRKYKVHLEPFD